MKIVLFLSILASLSQANTLANKAVICQFTDGPNRWPFAEPLNQNGNVLFTHGIQYGNLRYVAGIHAVGARFYSVKLSNVTQNVSSIYVASDEHPTLTKISLISASGLGGMTLDCLIK